MSRDELTLQFALALSGGVFASDWGGNEASIADAVMRQAEALAVAFINRKEAAA